MLRSMAFSYTRRSVVDVSKSQQNFSFLAKKVREFSSSSKRDANEHENASFNRVYTHPLSRVVLEHLQNVHGEWLVKNGLDRGLTINRGEHVSLKFSPYNAVRRRRNEATSVHMWHCPQINTHWRYRNLHSDDVAPVLSSHTCLCARPYYSSFSDGSFCIQFPVNSNDYDGGRIWYVCFCVFIQIKMYFNTNAMIH